MKRFIKRLKYKLIRLFSSQSAIRIENEERYLLIIVNKLLSLPETELLMVPDMNTFYIKKGKRSDKNGVLVIIDFSTGMGEIICCGFERGIKMSGRVSKHILKHFTEVVIQRRRDMENEYRSSIKHSLSNVLENVVKTAGTIDNETQNTEKYEKDSFAEQVENA